MKRMKHACNNIHKTTSRENIQTEFNLIDFEGNICNTGNNKRHICRRTGRKCHRAGRNILNFFSLIGSNQRAGYKKTKPDFTSNTQKAPKRSFSYYPFCSLETKCERIPSFFEDEIVLRWRYSIKIRRPLEGITGT